MVSEQIKTLDASYRGCVQKFESHIQYNEENKISVSSSKPGHVRNALFSNFTFLKVVSNASSTTTLFNLRNLEMTLQ